MGFIQYDGRQYEIEDLYAEVMMRVTGTAQRLGRVEWLPIVDWAEDGRKVVTYLLIAPGVPVSVQVDYEGEHKNALPGLLERYTRE
ncbi:hypothetical protein DEJ27_03160 [Curtobacterium sp. MCPF17_018]|uniref:hypothetical protein n=1 Tax=Curtobacterium sp. MCPF17_018 TaxID=2175638 RepID=UPI000DA9FF2D|nr:hypothetical protein [Curtobacterium sp. MCPF17_018]PZE71790.1 hypothetical protein DEJ27_03160 [Curtobacterium sp. MCPF17_018]